MKKHKQKSSHLWNYLGYQLRYQFGLYKTVSMDQSDYTLWRLILFNGAPDDPSSVIKEGIRKYEEA